MRSLARFILSLIFITGFLAVLAAGSIRWSLLSRSSWKQALSKSGAYGQMTDKTSEFINQKIKPEEVERLRLERESGKLSLEKQTEADRMI